MSNSMSCEKNILDLTLDASTPAATDVVMFTKADGTTVIRRWSTLLQRPFKRVMVKCNGTEGDSVTFLDLVGIPLTSIVDIQRSGVGVESIVTTPPVGLEAYYDGGVAGAVKFSTSLFNGEFVKVIYQ